MHLNNIPPIGFFVPTVLRLLHSNRQNFILFVIDRILFICFPNLQLLIDMTRLHSYFSLCIVFVTWGVCPGMEACSDTSESSQYI